MAAARKKSRPPYEKPPAAGFRAPARSEIAGGRLCLASDLVFQRLERHAPRGGGGVGQLADVGPGLLVNRDHQFVDALADHVALRALRRAEDHEGLARAGGVERIGQRLRGAAAVVDLDQIARRHPDVRHVGGVHLDDRIGEAVTDEVVLLIQEPVPPVQVRPPVVDEEAIAVALDVLARRDHAAPRTRHEPRPAVVAGEHAVGVEPGGADDGLALDAQHRLLKAVGAQRPQPVVSDIWVAGAVAVLERVLLAGQSSPLKRSA